MTTPPPARPPVALRSPRPVLELVAAVLVLIGIAAGLVLAWRHGIDAGLATTCGICTIGGLALAYNGRGG